MSDDFPTWSKETPMNPPTSIIHNGVTYNRVDTESRFKPMFEELYETSKQNYEAPYPTVNTVDPDNVLHPSHYTQDSDIECIDAIRASMTPESFAGYCKGNCLKYIWRYSNKNGIEDLEKAKVYLTWLIDTLKGEKLTK